MFRTLIAVFIVFTASEAFSEELVVYTSRKEHLVKDIFAQYTKETGVKVSYKTGKAPALIQTLKAEGEKSPADIFMTVDAGNLWHAADEGLLTPITSKKLTTNVPANLRDKDNKWFGLSVRARTIVYNPTKVKDGELADYETLATPAWKGRICLRTSKKVYNQSLVAMFIHELGETKAREVVKGWVNNTVEIFPNDTAVLKAVAAGQCAAGIVNTYYFGRLIKKDPKLPLKLFWPNQKNYGVHVNVSGAGIVKTSTKKKAAQAFLEWLADKEAQKSYAQVNMEYPINTMFPESDVTKKWGSFKANKTFNLSKAGSLQKEAIKLMREVKYK
jgi:iron(III) transport system substrate-binding protein